MGGQKGSQEISGRVVVRRRVGASRIAPFCCCRFCYEVLLIVGNPINWYQSNSIFGFGRAYGYKEN